jgi:hypothetical protein
MSVSPGRTFVVNWSSACWTRASVALGVGDDGDVHAPVKFAVSGLGAEGVAHVQRVAVGELEFGQVLVGETPMASTRSDPRFCSAWGFAGAESAGR